MLATRFNLAHVREFAPLTTKNFQPFPRYQDRKEWDALPKEKKDEWIKLAEEYLDYQWPAMTAEGYTTLSTTGNLKLHWNRFLERRSSLGVLAIAECMEGEGRFINQIVNGIISTCEETVWIGPLIMTKKDEDIPDESDEEIDLCSSETGTLLSWVLYLLGDKLAQISPRIPARIKQHVNNRIIKTYLNRNDYWWMGFSKSRANNWNPWCNANIIVCALLTVDDPEVRAEVLHKAMRSLDRYFEEYVEDGCCDEGPMYWGAAGAGLNTCIELLTRASGGMITASEDEKFRRIGQYITKVFIDGNYFVNYADGDALVTPKSAAYRFGKAIGDKGMMGLGAMGKTASPVIFNWFNGYGYLMEIFCSQERENCNYPLPYIKDSWMWVAGVITAREHESPEGLFLSAKAGNNEESHNHNDVGNFIVYADGKPVLLDIGTEEYRAQTFSPTRYEIWYTQSQYHNCPGVNGVMQHVGGQYKATDVKYDANGTRTALSMQLKDAYPANAGIASWRREVALERDKNQVCLTDSFELNEKSADVCRYFMTTRTPAVKNGEIHLAQDNERTAILSYDPTTTEVAIEEIPITESRVKNNWGSLMYRITLKERTPVKDGQRVVCISLSPRRLV
ncbi:MAG: heparinase II/III-family protein [Defluviitaleaceae bacterium]|nr:heparinase II/III-family protein [Defluviitaleaceae bacterium]